MNVHQPQSPHEADPRLHALNEWLLGEGRRFDRTRRFFPAFMDQLLALGVPVRRVLLSLRTIHPQVVVTGYIWRDGQVVVMDRGFDILDSDQYLKSPIKLVHDGAEMLRYRLTGKLPPNVEEMEVIGEFRELGMTDYVAFALQFSDGTRNAFTLATDAPDGFSDADIALLKEIRSVLSLILEVQSERRIAAALLDTYVGNQAGQRILSGDIQRGTGQAINAVIWYGDLRGFTEMSETLSTDEVIGTLNDYFDCMTNAIHSHGGQVLKFIGDGILAIFPLGDAAFLHYAARQALDAAVEVERGIEAQNVVREQKGLPEMRFGLSLHVGEVIYGNIGSVDRLDFTAIGPAVNLAARLEPLSSELGVPIVMSRRFAEVAGTSRAVSSLGLYMLRGVREPVEVFTLTEDLPHGDPHAGEAGDGI